MSSDTFYLHRITQKFKAEAEQLFGNHIVSLIAYGSAATDEYVHKKSDINILLVLDEEGILNLHAARKKIAAWYKRGLHTLFLTESYIERSLDSFPIEFLNMKSAYHVVTGKDVLQSLEFDRHNIRLQCERELKGNLIHLRQRFVLNLGDKNELMLLIGESLGAFAAIFRALLYLKVTEVPINKLDVTRQACKDFAMDEDLFSQLISIRRGEEKPSIEELETLVGSYIRQIDALSRYVDDMQL